MFKLTANKLLKYTPLSFCGQREGSKKERVDRNGFQKNHGKQKKPDLKKYTLYACIQKNTLEKTNLYYDTSRTVVALCKGGSGD